MNGSIPWTRFYNTEEELLCDMMKAQADVNNTMYHKLVKGYVYIHSFQRYYKKNGKLTDKQMAQLKRMAQFVYANVNNNNIPCHYRVEDYK